MYTSLDFTLALSAAQAELQSTIDALIRIEEEGGEDSRLQRRAEALRKLIDSLEDTLRKAEAVEETEI